MKLNVLLALTDTLRSKYKNMVVDYTKFFLKTQRAFLGGKNTYEAREGYVEDGSKIGYVRVVTTVGEKVDYFIKEAELFINAQFSQEKTNASGLAVADLIVGTDNWGSFTSLELLRLKTLIESGDLGNLEPMLSVIPVRSDAEIWNKTTEEEYTDREIWETPKISGETRTTEKEEYILQDPNIATGKVTSSYVPKVSYRTKTVVIGDYTRQSFSGEWSQRQRAMALKRRSDLLAAVVVALKECNSCETQSSELTAEKIFGFIFKG